MYTDGMRDCANARAGGCRGVVAPPELFNSFNAALNAKTRLPSQKWLNRSSGVRRGSAAPPESTALTTHLVQLRCRRRLRPIFCDPQDHTLLVISRQPLNRLGSRLFCWALLIQGWVIRRRRIIRRIVLITYLTVFFKLLRIIQFWALDEFCSHKPPRSTPRPSRAPQRHFQAL